MSFNSCRGFSVFEEIDMVVVEVFRSKPVAEIPWVVKELKAIADTSDGVFDDVIE